MSEVARPPRHLEAGRPVRLVDLARAAERTRYWTTQRDERIRHVVAGGVSQRQVAKVAGLSHTAVQAIVKKTSEC